MQNVISLCQEGQVLIVKMKVLWRYYVVDQNLSVTLSRKRKKKNILKWNTLEEPIFSLWNYSYFVIYALKNEMHSFLLLGCITITKSKLIHKTFSIFVYPAPPCRSP